MQPAIFDSVGGTLSGSDGVDVRIDDLAVQLHQQVEFLKGVGVLGPDREGFERPTDERVGYLMLVDDLNVFQREVVVGGKVGQRDLGFMRDDL